MIIKELMKFIMFSLVFSLLLNSCNESEKISIDTSLYIGVINTLIANAEYENRRSKIKYFQIKKELNNPLKAKISRFREGFNELESNREEFTLLIKPLVDRLKETDRDKMITKEEVFRVQEFLKKRGAELYEVSVRVINENFEYLNISKKKKEELLRELSQNKLSIIENDTIAEEEINNYLNRPLVLLMLQSSFYEYQREIEIMFTDLIYARTYCSFEKYFPVVIEQSSGCLNKGDLLKMEIGIGTYSSLIDPQSARIIVDNDTLVINDSGVATYEKLVDITGEHKFSIECIMIDSLTGGVNRGTSDFIYEVN